MICKSCGVQVKEGSKFCQNCGHNLLGNPCPHCHEVTGYLTPYCVACGKLIKEKSHLRKNKSFKKRAMAFISAIVIFTAGVFAYIIWDPFSKMDQKNQALENTSLSLEDFASGTEAFEISYEDMIHVKAAENALDKPRDFKISLLDEEDLQVYGETLVEEGMLVLKGIKIDGGMTSSDLLPGYLEVTVDMKALGISEAMYDYIDFVYYNDAGYIEVLNKSIEGDEAYFVMNKNSAIVVALPYIFAFGVGGLIKLYQLKPEAEEKNLSAFPTFKGKKIFRTDILSGYDIFWPETLGYKNEAEIIKQNERLSKALSKHGFSSIEQMHRMTQTNYGPEVIERVLDVFNDPLVREIVKLIESPQWQLDNFIPESVQYTIEGLKVADDYLFNVRKFKRPTHLIEVGVVSPWPHGGQEMGLVNNPHLYPPYMHINADMDLKDKDDFYVTLTHELFHVVQPQYIHVDWTNRVWFWEATARVLEKEASDYFYNRGIIASQKPLTFRDYFEGINQSYGLPDQWENISDLNTFHIQNGYMSSYFLEHIKDKYFSAYPEMYLESLLKLYNKDKNIHNILKNTAFLDDQAYNQEFINYHVDIHRNAYAQLTSKLKTESLTGTKPYSVITFEQKPWTANFASLQLDYDETKYTSADVKMIIKGVGIIENTYQYFDVSQLYPLNHSSLVEIKGITNKKPFALESIYGGGEDNLEYQIHAFMMLKPEAPVLEHDEDKNTLEITLPSNRPLMDQGYVSSYLVTVTGQNDKVLMISTRDSKVTVDLDDLSDVDLGTQALSEDLNMDLEAMIRAADVLFGTTNENTYKVFINEVAESDFDTILGPQSDISELNIKGESTADVDILGVWKGKVQFTNESITVEITNGKDGYDYTMKISMYEGLEFYGNDLNNGTVIFGEDQGFSFTLIKNSKNELYLTAPPVTLKK